MPTESSDAGQCRALLFIHALTSLHPGTGTALGHVDLPVQRERHTAWPLIPGSSLKGVLREMCRPSTGGDEKNGWLAVFGPETSDAAAHAGALSLTDARILAFPVRSLKGVFAWVTSAGVLDRLRRDLSLVSGSSTLPAFPQLDPNRAAFDDCLAVDGALVLEEYDFTRADAKELPEVANWVARHALANEDTRKRLGTSLVVLSDDDFGHFVRHATEVSARIGLDYETKTVKGGALFYEEFLPPETLFYALVLAEESRRPNLARRMPSAEVLGYLRSHLPEGHVLQIGGDETIGKGLCALRLSNGKEG